MTTANDGVPVWAVKWLSQPRLVPYVQAAGESGALELYRWNSQVSAALFELIGWFEVAWRNTVDSAITDRRPAQAPHWLFDPAFPLPDRTRAKVTEAVGYTRMEHPPIGKVIAELTLGFWRFTAHGYRQTVWQPYLHRAFPHAPHQPDVKKLDRKLESVIRLRNRVAHHEPVGLPEELHRRIADMLMIGGWINPQMAQWWRRHTTAQEAVSAYPLSR